MAPSLATYPGLKGLGVNRSVTPPLAPSPSEESEGSSSISAQNKGENALLHPPFAPSLSPQVGGEEANESTKTTHGTNFKSRQENRTTEEEA